jgi:predicted NUDIX family NTP pyrophosphohydrolase
MKKAQGKVSAGLLMYRIRAGQLEVFLAHPGGLFFKNKDDGHWSIPKGEIGPAEDQLDAAKREFEEEVGLAPGGDFIPLGAIQQKGGKIVHGWAFAGDWDESRVLQSNTFEMEWPPRSGRRQSFPEIDRVGFFTIPEARKKMKETQHPFLDRLREKLARNDGRSCEPGK